ncbi:dihydrolipoamide acetyltransferase family protein [Kutzneria sp. 744]|uniref:dihydrolipoamide acetyltransferase family protein n=1 Tax=Kutzneria sp. (strain 744) TaxID=345341 RepID=UPI0003EED0A8|nr:dihydrolipoamide acetyltransferase family protein [Kutzneria sp. 744]EWM13729.1 pyruvate dehydrogenase E2 component [Kutzneria sp. 744]
MGGPLTLVEFPLPDLGEGLMEAEVVRWLVAIGDDVAVDQPLVEVETAKATVEIPSPHAGTVVTLHAGEGAVVRVTEPLVTVRSEQHRVLVGYGVPPEEPRRNTGVTSPVVRRLAVEHGVDLRSVQGTAVNGMITRADVMAAVTAGERVPLRRALAEKLTRAASAPTATVWVDADVTGLVELREVLRETDSPGLLTLFARCAVVGLRRFPALNSSVQDNEIVRHSTVNLGIATQTAVGLVVPVVRAADQYHARRLHGEITRLVTAARRGEATNTELTGGTFTLNNYGVYGVDGSAALVNHPEAAILGVGRVMDRPWVIDGSLVVRKVAQLSLVFDHRVCDGDVAGGFLRYVADLAERPAIALADF